MPTSVFEKLLPWSGALAGAVWAVQFAAAKTADDPEDPQAVAVVAGAVARNYAAGFALLAGSFLLVLFAAAARRTLRAGEAGESTYSSIAHGGLLVAAAGFGTLGIL
ncbi:hypothetical protein Dvina_25685 [Dactylosporangium vinaceum]|uniref:Integral membrane protein n=1 Tax=Dactylosporangium vinaceum TaxID=53362 RepID=A0ABV5MDK2_9ACTN|nr:hypothetical protein [Dactylosporangium vinaceum]UAC01139.1 hypothetical protein Dvina_25685 [Dactylosporangium vinaceum]